jgi:hypothetical protein
VEGNVEFVMLSINQRASIKAKGIFIIILDLPSIILEPVLVNLDTQFHKVLQAFVLTSEHDPEVIRIISPPRKQWLVERCIVYEPSKDKFNQNVSLTTADSDSDNSGPSKSEDEVTRMSYGSLGPIEAWQIIKLAPIIFDLCLKRQTGISLKNVKKSRKLRGGRTAGQPMKDSVALRWNDIGEEEMEASTPSANAEEIRNSEAEKVRMYIEHAKKYRQMLEEPSMYESLVVSGNRVLEVSSEEEEEEEMVLDVATGSIGIDIVTT